MQPPLVGVFVGGRATRMGGVAKGLLRRNGQSLLERLLAACRDALGTARVVLVGNDARYDDLALPALSDDPPGVGPLGGLRALLAEAARAGTEHVLALSVDLPDLDAALIRRLATEHPDAIALAAKSDDRWEPLVARYSISVLPAVDALLAERRYSMQPVFARIAGAIRELALSAEERRRIRDWDCPDDIDD